MLAVEVELLMTQLLLKLEVTEGEVLVEIQALPVFWEQLILEVEVEVDKEHPAELVQPAVPVAKAVAGVRWAAACATAAAAVDAKWRA